MWPKDQETKLTSINTSHSQYLPIILQASTFKNATKEFQFSQKNSHIKQKDSKTDWKHGIYFYSTRRNRGMSTVVNEVVRILPKLQKYLH